MPWARLGKCYRPIVHPQWGLELYPDCLFSLTLEKQQTKAVRSLHFTLKAVILQTQGLELERPGFKSQLTQALH